jgi:heat-inducible transcriptional repressor
MQQTLTKRQEYILGLIVREYAAAPTPIGSKGLVEKYRLGFSSATVRNDMAVLEEHGLIGQPHTSAGRIPTEAGYRYFVQRLIGDTELSVAEKRMIRHQFHQASLNLEEWMRLAASVLAHTVRSASLVTSPLAHRARFKHVELISTQGRLVLMVLVLEGGHVRQQMLTLAETVSQERLSQAAQHINHLLTGLDEHAVRARAPRQPVLEQEIIELIADLMGSMGQGHRSIYHDGLANILDPDYLLDQAAVIDPLRREELLRAVAEVDSEGARQALRLLEEESLLEEVLAEVLAPGFEGVQVMIGGEGRWEELSHASVVLSRYGIHGQATGTLGVLGPTRLHYGRAVSAVRYLGGLLSDLLIEVYGRGPGHDADPISSS